MKDAGSPEASIAVLRSEGFDVTSSDMRDAAADRFGGQLTPEQLDAVAAGYDLSDADRIALGAAFIVVAAAAAL